MLRCGVTDALEQCQGYLDSNGIWNNGFFCPRWGGPDDVYCCGDGGERFCCPEPAPDLGPSTPSDGGSDNTLALYDPLTRFYSKIYSIVRYKCSII